eukprot:7386235-Prymnesium_polylepis.2
MEVQLIARLAASEDAAESNPPRLALRKSPGRTPAEVCGRDSSPQPPGSFLTRKKCPGPHSSFVCPALSPPTATQPLSHGWASFGVFSLTPSLGRSLCCGWPRLAVCSL